MIAESNTETRAWEKWIRPDLGLLRLTRKTPPELRLLGTRQRLHFAALTIERVIVGCCDLLLAGSMYLLFLLLQGAHTAHTHWWTPPSTLAAALDTAALVVIRVALDLFSTRSIVAYVQDLSTDLLLQLTQGYNELQWTRFVQRNRSELLNHTTSTAREAANFYHLSIEIVASSIVILLMTAALIDQSPLVATGLAATVALFYGLHRFLVRARLQRAALEREESSRILHRTLADMFASAREMRSYSIGAFLQERIRGQARTVGLSYRRIAFLPHVARTIADQGVVLLFLLVVTAVELRHGDTRQLLSLLVFYFVLCRRLLPMISQLSFLVGQMESSYKSVLVISDELLDCATNRRSELMTHVPQFGFILELDDVCFSFPKCYAVLNNISLSMRTGDTVILRGASGSGKSSLLNLVAGLLEPSSGALRVERDRVAYVPQEIVLLDDSIRNNLLFGPSQATDQELMNALSVANLSEFVSALPLGLETQVGDNGVLLSGGQRQRIGLARAILRGASLLLLDEATSALDEANETLILDNLKASGVAILLVTHRLHRTGQGGRVVRLEHGYLFEDASEADEIVRAQVHL